MTNKPTGGHAFPPSKAHSPASGFSQGESGMTLRDYFAGQALISLAKGDAPWDQIALEAYAAADAMIKERNK